MKGKNSLDTIALKPLQSEISLRNYSQYSQFLPLPLSEEDEDDNSNESTAAAAENEYEHLKQQAVEYISIKHPIMFETYSICKMAKASNIDRSFLWNINKNGHHIC